MRNYDIRFDLKKGRLKYMRANCSLSDSFKALYENEKRYWKETKEKK